MKTHPLTAALLVLLLVVSIAVPAAAGVDLSKTDTPCSIASLEQDLDCNDSCPFLTILAEDNICTADDTAGLVSVACTVGSAMYKGAKMAAITGAKMALTATTMIVTGMVQLGSLVSPA